MTRIYTDAGAIAGLSRRAIRTMAEKAVDETPAVGGMNVFNAVTSRIHPSPLLKIPDRRSVAGAWRTGA